MNSKKILIIDETSFSRICSALLGLKGYVAEALQDLSQFPQRDSLANFGLVVVSHPYGAGLFEALSDAGLPVLVLSDCINDALLSDLKIVRNSYCMVKPLDYEQFNSFVGQVFTGVSAGVSAFGGGSTFD